jgi:hypothetical protein
MSATGTVYLTDGFDRLPLPGRRCEFRLDTGWIAHGTTCSWTWPFEWLVNIAGAEVEMDGIPGGATVSMDVGHLDGPPEVVGYGQTIRFTPRIHVEFAGQLP